MAMFLATIGQAKKHYGKKIKHFFEDVKDFVEENEDSINTIFATLPDAEENGEILYTYFDRLVKEQDNGPLPVKNTTCIARHCKGAIAACAADSTCRTNLGCSGNCPKQNTTCTVACSLSY